MRIYICAIIKYICLGFVLGSSPRALNPLECPGFRIVFCYSQVASLITQEFDLAWVP